jgi:serine/threonine-protein kinase HipA
VPQRAFWRKKGESRIALCGGADAEDAEQFRENRKRISISGVQIKASLVLDQNKLRLTHPGERGGYILKPIPYDVKHAEYVPANEHLTMQIARQVYKIPAAENALVFFKDGPPAYLTRRFDVKPDGTRYGQEDFASLSHRTKENAGVDFKYKGSYEGIGRLIRQYVPAAQVELVKFFRLVLFNYLFNNGDAHLKNFSLIETTFGDYILSPAYDLMSTSLHVNDSYFALEDGLFAEEDPEGHLNTSATTRAATSCAGGKKLDLPEKVLSGSIAFFRTDHPFTHELIRRSFLSEDLKDQYRQDYLNRLRAIQQ